MNRRVMLPTRCGLLLLAHSALPLCALDLGLLRSHAVAQEQRAEVAQAAQPTPRAKPSDKPKARAKRQAAKRAASAAEPSKAPKKEQPPTASSPASSPSTTASGAGEKPAPEPESQATSGAAPTATVDQADVRTEESGTQVKVMEFSGLDIEGQLKTPQMLYFLNRLRAEFGRPRLPHRSFMPELQRGTQEKALR